jgi:hypothetical protein
MFLASREKGNGQHTPKGHAGLACVTVHIARAKTVKSAKFKKDALATAVD